MPLLIRNATLDGRAVDCLIDGGVYTAISPSLDAPHGAEVLDAGGDYIVPPFFNAHTHIPMNLFRGLADDIPLMPWLKEHIWPAEAKLTAADIRRGARLAIDEMVRSGTVFFNDLYWHAGEVVEAIDLTPGGEVAALCIPAGQWHTVEVLESGTVILECKDGPWTPLAPEDILSI